MTKAAGIKTHLGSCHCSDVLFEVEIDASAGSKCNCTICTKTSLTSGIVKPAAFVLLSDPDKLSAYEWGGMTAKRFFCKRCGVHCFGRGYLEEVGGDYVSINLNCLDNVDLQGARLSYWDGRHDNWGAGPRSTPWPIVRAEDRTARAPLPFDGASTHLRTA